MPTFTFNSPEGKSYSVQGPDGATPEQAFQILQQSLGSAAPAAAPQEPAAPVTVNNVARSAAEGVPIIGGTLNKLDAATNAALAPVLNRFFAPDDQLQEPTFGERYAHSLRDQEGMSKGFEQDHPIVDTGAKLAGGVAAMIPAMAAAPAAFGLTGPTLAGRVAAGAASGGALGGADAAVRGEDVTKGAALGAALGGAGPVAGHVVGKVAQGVRDIVSPGAGAEAISTAEAIKDAATTGYEAIRDLGVTVKPESVQALARDVRADLRGEGHREYLSPKTFGVLDELENGEAFTSGAKPGGAGAQRAQDVADIRAKYGDDVASAFERQAPAADGASQAVTFSDLHGLRRALGKAAQSIDPVEKAAASKAITRLDDYLEKIPASDVIGGDAGKAAAMLKEANANYHISKLSERLQSKIGAAELQAASANSGANLENALRQRLKDILKSPKLSQGFNQHEKLAMQRIVRGSASSNIIRALGNILGGGGGIGTLLSGGAGALAGGPVGAVVAPAAGMALKKIGARMTEAQLERLDAMIRSRAPHSEQGKAVMAALEQARAARLAAAGARGAITGGVVNPIAGGVLLDDRRERRK